MSQLFASDGQNNGYQGNESERTGLGQHRGRVKRGYYGII